MNYLAVLLLLLCIILPNNAYADGVEDKYVNFLKSGKYQIVCTIDKYDSSMDKGNSQPVKCILAKSTEDQISLVQREYVYINVKDPFIYSLFLDLKNRHYLCYRADKKMLSNKKVNIYSHNIDDKYFTAAAVESYLNNFRDYENNIFKFLGPITEACGLISGYKVKFVQSGQSTIDGQTANFKEFSLGDNKKNKLRMYYVDDNLIKVVNIDVNEKSSSFIPGMKQKNYATTSITFSQFDDKINYGFLPKEVLAFIGRQ